MREGEQRADALEAVARWVQPGAARVGEEVRRL